MRNWRLRNRLGRWRNYVEVASVTITVLIVALMLVLAYLNLLIWLLNG